MTKKISFMNPKGGAGKTISSINFSYGLVNRGFKVLLIDTDPRGGVGTSLGIKNKNTIFEMIREYKENFITDKNKYITNKNGLDIINAGYELSKFTSYFENDAVGAVFVMKDIIEEHLFGYDYIVIDTEGTVNTLTSSVLFATQDVFIPTQASNLDLTGVRDILDAIRNTSKKNPELSVKKVFLVRSKKNTNAYRDYKDSLEIFFKEDQFSEISIRENQDIINAVNNYQDIFSYKNSSNGAIDYRNLVDEYLEENRS